MNFNILPKFMLLKSAAFVFAVVIIACYSIFEVSFNTTFYAVFLSFGILYVIGKYGLKVIKKLPHKISKWLHSNIFPDINGNWHGTISSNWEEKGEFTSKLISVTINHDLFTTSMSFESDDGYTNSELVMSKIERDTRTNKFKLYYLYDALTPQYQDTDERSHHGSACLTINYENDYPEMRGNYWTDRNWRTNQNTAGEINLVLTEADK